MSTEQLIFLCLSFRGSGRLFSRCRVIDELPDEAIDLSVDRIQGRFRVAAAVLAHRAGGDLDGVEGVHNAYVTSARIRSIEIIVFPSTILGLALAVNALQMRPFYDAATENALSRPIFWWVFAGIIGAGFVLRGVLTQRSRTRKIIHWLKKRRSSPTTP